MLLHLFWIHLGDESQGDRVGGEFAGRLRGRPGNKSEGQDQNCRKENRSAHGFGRGFITDRPISRYHTKPYAWQRKISRLGALRFGDNGNRRHTLPGVFASARRQLTNIPAMAIYVARFSIILKRFRFSEN